MNCSTYLDVVDEDKMYVIRIMYLFMSNSTFLSTKFCINITSHLKTTRPTCDAHLHGPPSPLNNHKYVYYLYTFYNSMII